MRKYSDGEKLCEAGKISPGMFVVLKGQVALTQRDGLGHLTPVAEQGEGQFSRGCGPAFHARDARRRNGRGRRRDSADPDRGPAVRSWWLKPNSASASCGR